MHKIPLCVIAMAALVSPVSAQSGSDGDAGIACDARSQDCDDGDGISDTASLRGGGNDPLKGTNAQTCLVRPKECKGNPAASGNGEDDPDAAAGGSPKQTGKELKGIPARDGEPASLPPDSDDDGFEDAASQNAGDPIPGIDITI